MRKGRHIFAGLSITVLLLSGGTVALADVDNGLLIGSFSPTGAYAGEQTGITVSVFEVKTEGGSRGALDEANPTSDAWVDVMLTQGQQQIKAVLVYGKKGHYKGVVTFPNEGIWKSIVTARYKEHAEKNAIAPETKDDVFEAAIEVKAPRMHRVSGFPFWIVGVILLSVALLLIVAYRRKKKTIKLNDFQ